MATSILWRSQLARLIQILLAVGSGRNPNASTLAKLCEVSPRTVYRDLDTLILAGVPIEFRPELRGYRIAPGGKTTASELNLNALRWISEDSKFRVLVRVDAKVSDEFRSQFSGTEIPASLMRHRAEESCLEIAFAGMEQAIARLLPFAEFVEVIEPFELRSRLHEMGDRIARRHGANPATGVEISDRGSVAC